MSDYREVLQNPQVCFDNIELQKASLQNNPLGLPVLVSGGFVVTACATVNSSGSQIQWAIRCFYKEVLDLQERYKYISDFLNRQNEDFFVKFTYEPQSIRVHGQLYPIIKMDWVDGLLLNQYIYKYIKEPKRLLALADEIKRISIRLSQLKMGHGDLQNGNIIIKNSGKCVVVDYDGMYVPEMPYNHSNEIGHPSFQHPGRDGSFFNDRMDNFSLIVIWTTLSILSTSSGPDLWQRYHNSENLIFSKEDYKNPNQSPLFSELINHPEVGKWVKRLKNICSYKIEDIPRLEKFLVQDGTALNDPVYRFYNSSTQKHFYTAVTSEKDNLINNLSLGYSYEGRAFYVSFITGTGLVPVWRFYNPVSQDHFYTANPSEKNSLINPNSGYNYEGIAFYAYCATSTVDSPVYRYYNATTGKHFFTANTLEIAGLTNNWVAQGVAFRAAI